MSRSYKKQPVVKYAPRGNYGQKQANRRIRRYNGHIPFGMFYKKFYEQWDIHDIKDRRYLSEFLKSRENWIKWCEKHNFNFLGEYYGFTLKEAIYKWKRGYILK